MRAVYGLDMPAAAVLRLSSVDAGADRAVFFDAYAVLYRLYFLQAVFLARRFQREELAAADYCRGRGLLYVPRAVAAFPRAEDKHFSDNADGDAGFRRCRRCEAARETLTRGLLEKEVFVYEHMRKMRKERGRGRRVLSLLRLTASPGRG
ncbi:hypothetical protein SDC9_193502 [bioreactor metagenome]|uniref:Uncharacterized protein n=1 Tax=bioreactor metagenome TaxID=1076179 RepID=A0A645IEX4_9ZZZZ